MHLSKVKLKSNSPRSRYSLGNPYEWHRVLWSLFRHIDGPKAPFLFRVEDLTLSNGASVLLQSDSEPVETDSSATILLTKEFEPNFKKGSCFRFKLTANATKTIRDSENLKRKLRVPLISRDEQISWLLKKFDGVCSLPLDQNGKPLVDINSNNTLYFNTHKNGGHRGKIVTVNFEGLMLVQDPYLLDQYLKTGIGPAKSFGCGLLSLARV